jgi:hypothetical protein
MQKRIENDLAGLLHGPRVLVVEDNFPGLAAPRRADIPSTTCGQALAGRPCWAQGTHLQLLRLDGTYVVGQDDDPFTDGFGLCCKFDS